jgi:hypothetical protein
MFSHSFHRKTFKLHILHIINQERHFEIMVSMDMHNVNLVSSVKTAWQYKHSKDDDDKDDDDDDKSLAYLCLVMVNWLMTLYDTMKQCHLLLLLPTSICNSDWLVSMQTTDWHINKKCLTYTNNTKMAPKSVTTNLLS